MLFKVCDCNLGSVHQQDANITAHKVPKLPGGNKRKLPDNPTPEMLKKMRADTPSPPPAEEKPKSRKATVEDVGDEDVDMDRDFAPGGDADYFVEEDDEGRFFGGGLTGEQKEILNIFDNAGGEGVLEDVRISLWDKVNLISLNSAAVSWKSCLSLEFGECSSALNGQ